MLVVVVLLCFLGSAWAVQYIWELDKHPRLKKKAISPFSQEWDNSIAICAIMRRERVEDIREWLQYHRCGSKPTLTGAGALVRHLVELACAALHFHVNFNRTAALPAVARVSTCSFGASAHRAIKRTQWILGCVAQCRMLACSARHSALQVAKTTPSSLLQVLRSRSGAAV